VFPFALEFDFTLRTVALGAALIGAVSGALGSFALLRRQSLLGDVISHAALPGIVLAFLVTGSRELPVLLLGAALAGWVATLAITAMLRGAGLSEDTALGLVLSTFFGVGLVLLTWIQGRAGAAQAGLDTFLFGQAATMLPADVAWIAAVGGTLLVVVALLWKGFRLLSFDPGFAASIGLPVGRLDLLLTGTLVVAIVLGVQMVGVILMSTLLVAPAAAARQWTRSLGGLVLLAGALGGAAGFFGALVSASAPRLPTGPVVVLVATAFVLVSLAFAPERGGVAGWRRRRRVRGEVRAEVRGAARMGDSGRGA
jgi:manganese/zinc/iron transport system permease protein